MYETRVVVYFLCKKVIELLIINISHFQALVARVQKERDSALAEAASCRERAEAANVAAGRAARDRDSAATELDVLRERWEKAHQQHQKLTVTITWHKLNTTTLVFI